MISLSLSFHWWSIPLAIFLFGVLIAVYDNYTSRGAMAGFGGFLLFICCTLISTGMIIGYWFASFVVNMIK